MRLPQDRILHIDTELAGDEVRVVAEWQGEIVRCKDCRYRKKVSTSYYCELDEFNVKDADFCSWGERREEVNGFKSVGQAWNTSQGRWEP